jgi:hypothetical protein
LYDGEVEKYITDTVYFIEDSIFNLTMGYLSITNYRIQFMDETGSPVSSIPNTSIIGIESKSLSDFKNYKYLPKEVTACIK